MVYGSRARGENGGFVGFGWRLRGGAYDARVDSATFNSWRPSASRVGNRFNLSYR